MWCWSLSGLRCMTNIMMSLDTYLRRNTGWRQGCWPCQCTPPGGRSVFVHAGWNAPLIKWAWKYIQVFYSSAFNLQVWNYSWNWTVSAMRPYEFLDELTLGDEINCHNSTVRALLGTCVSILNVLSGLKDYWRRTSLNVIPFARKWA